MRDVLKLRADTPVSQTGVYIGSHIHRRLLDAGKTLQHNTRRNSHLDTTIVFCKRGNLWLRADAPVKNAGKTGDCFIRLPIT